VVSLSFSFSVFSGHDHREPVTAVILARQFSCAPPWKDDQCGRIIKAAGTSVKDGKAIAPETGLAKPPTGTGQQWTSVSNLVFLFWN
jgi:hypothetical protein